MEKIFTKGLWFKEWAEPMPKFIKAKISIKVPDFISFLQEHQSNAGYVNITVLESKNGTLYCELDQFKPKEKEIIEEVKEEKEICIDPENGNELSVDDIPF